MEINTTAAEISTTAVEFGTAAAEFSTSVLLMRRMTNQSRRRLFTSSPSAVCIHISEFIIADCLIFNRIEFELIADSNPISCCGVRFLISYLKFYAVNLRLFALTQNLIFKFLMYLHFFTRIPSRNSMNINIEGLSITLLVIFYTSVRSIYVTLGAELRRPKYWA
ncbi:hypothetical protein KY290_010269 [Solanum tuberosum]|uniref:Uncharacterized protein n=1 Tax=Solanum tuberosum TaxID=4113 RepID=A0ABQ7W012_SOLTU|nr:hypothetical protein KY289_010655 [Solanum tuberosum]KAH0773132.1 hypothetical protein KY290_010269 [Solanum tuberosum]